MPTTSEASGLVGYIAAVRITRQFQINAPHQKTYGFEPMHGPCWSSVVRGLRKSWIWLSEMASLSAVDLPVGSEVKGQCGSRSGCFTNSKEPTFNIVQHRSTSLKHIQPTTCCYPLLTFSFWSGLKPSLQRRILPHVKLLKHLQHVADVAAAVAMRPQQAARVTYFRYFSSQRQSMPTIVRLRKPPALLAILPQCASPGSSR